MRIATMTDEERRTRILVVEGDPEIATWLETAVRGIDRTPVEVAVCERLSEACELLLGSSFELIFLDLFLDDEQGMDCFVRVGAEVPGVPIIVIARQADRELAEIAVSTGAFATLIVDEGVPADVVAMANQALGSRTEQAAGGGSFGESSKSSDDLMRDAQRVLSLARGSGKSLLLLAVRVDGIDAIEERFGPGEVTRALDDTEGILRKTLRASDVLIRIGNEGFIGIAIVNPTDNGDAIVAARLDELLDAHKVWNPRPWNLTLLRSARRFDADGVADGETLVGWAMDNLVELSEVSADEV